VQASVTASIEQGYLSPSYGVKLEAPVIKFNRKAAECSFYTVLYPYKNARPALTITPTPVLRGGNACTPLAAMCLSITINTAGKACTHTVFIANEHGKFTVDGCLINTGVFFQRRISESNCLGNLFVNRRMGQSFETQDRATGL
jgi:hypothetical protein